MKFTATLELHGKTATGIEVPEEVVTRLGSGKRPRVLVTINGYTYRSTVAVMGGQNLLPVSAENRTAASVSAGDIIDVQLELDAAPREVEVPDDLAAALRKNPAAKKAFEALSFSNQNGYVTAINGAKAAETRSRRIATTVEKLNG